MATSTAGYADGLTLHSTAPRTLLTGNPLPVCTERRSCEHPECDTRLSRYNFGTTCAVHGGWRERAATRAVRAR